jgi:hypothetical protein
VRGRPCPRVVPTLSFRIEHRRALGVAPNGALRIERRGYHTARAVPSHCEPWWIPGHPATLYTFPISRPTAAAIAHEGDSPRHITTRLVSASCSQEWSDQYGCVPSVSRCEQARCWKSHRLAQQRLHRCLPARCRTVRVRMSRSTRCQCLSACSPLVFARWLAWPDACADGCPARPSAPRQAWCQCRRASRHGR